MVVSIDILSEEFDVNKIVISPINDINTKVYRAGEVAYASVDYIYPDGKKRPFYITIEDFKLVNEPYINENSKFLKGNKYDKQRFKFIIDITNNKKIIEIMKSIDDKLREFGKNSDNNDTTMQFEYFGCCKEPTLLGVSAYKKASPDKTKGKTNEEIMAMMHTYIKPTLKTKYDKNAIDKSTNGASIIECLITKEKEVDLNIPSSEEINLDYFINNIKRNCNVDIVINLSKWYAMTKMYGYKTSLTELHVNEISTIEENITFGSKKNKVKENKVESVVEEKTSETSEEVEYEEVEVDEGESEKEEEVVIDTKPQRRTIRKANK